MRCTACTVALLVACGTLDQHAPQQVEGISSVSSIAAGAWHTCAVRRDHQLSCWGRNELGQLGFDATADFETTPTTVVLDREVSDVAAGSVHTCAQHTDGTVSCWGDNTSGQLGLPSADCNAATPCPAAPTKLDLQGVVDVVAGGAEEPTDFPPVRPALALACAVLADHTVACWGANTRGQLGNATTSPLPDGPALVLSSPGVALGDVVRVAAGAEHACALDVTGSIWCWGDASRLQVGIEGSVVARRIENLSTATAIAAGSYHTCATLTAGEVACWGWNLNGQSGEYLGLLKEPAGVVVLPRAAIMIATGSAHTCALTDDEAMFCWGNDDFGQLGLGR